MFAKKEFAGFAKKNFVLMEVDFPLKKRQSVALQRANEALKEKYQVDGLGVLVITDADGKKLGEVEYEGGGPKALIGKLDKFRAQ